MFFSRFVLPVPHSFFNICFQNCRVINDIKFEKNYFESLSEIEYFFGELPYCVKTSSGFLVGFIFPECDYNALGMSIWIPYKLSFHEKYESMKILAECGICLDYLLFEQNPNKYRYLELNTSLNFIERIIKKYIPNINICRIRKGYVILYGEYKKLIKCNIDSLLVNYNIILYL